MKDPTCKLRTATSRAKSDVANKLISMFLHELSRKICREWGVRVEGEEYGELVRSRFGNRCPYCRISLVETTTVVEHLDGMNRYRVGLHIPGNVVVACRRCNSEKRRDDASKSLMLADSGWGSFLSHDDTRCPAACANCRYWKTVWTDDEERKAQLLENLQRIQAFRNEFAAFEATMTPLLLDLPNVLSKLYSDCQVFAATEIETMLRRY
jgi:hypothetical protein